MLKGAHIQTTIMVEIPFVFSVWISRSLRILYLILICLFKSLFCWITQFLWQKIISSAVNFFGVHLAHFSPAESFDHQKEEITTTPLWRSIKQLDPILLMQTFTAFTASCTPRPPSAKRTEGPWGWEFPFHHDFPLSWTLHLSPSSSIIDEKHAGEEICLLQMERHQVSKSLQLPQNLGETQPWVNIMVIAILGYQPAAFLFLRNLVIPWFCTKSNNALLEHWSSCLSLCEEVIFSNKSHCDC